MFHILIKQGVNGWIVEVRFPGFVEIEHVFNQRKDLLIFLEETIPEMQKGYISFLKAITKK